MSWLQIEGVVPEVMNMPRTVQDILDHADELTSRFENYEPTPQDERDPEALSPDPLLAGESPWNARPVAARPMNPIWANTRRNAR
jgi:hypothetical protein